MKIILNENDLKALSKSTVNEIFSLISKKRSIEDNEDKPYDMTIYMAKRFMSGVSDKTKSFLKVFADNQGIGKIDDLLNVTGSKILRDLNGIQAGLTRRLRKLDVDDESEVYLLGWENDESDKDWEGYFFISEITTQSLKNYFNK